MTVSHESVKAAARRLERAAATGEPCSPVRDLIGRDDLAAAYAVQDAVTSNRIAAGAKVVGRKIGLTSPAVQRQLGVDQPDFGVLFDSMAHRDGDEVAADCVSQPRVEAEVAFVLAEDLDVGPLDVDQVRSATAFVVAAIEICGSRIRNWDIAFSDTVADNASAGAYVLGRHGVTLEKVVPREVEMTMSVDGRLVSQGNGAACLGDPVEAVVWLARTARAFGSPLRAGQIVLSGALGPMSAVVAGQQVSATLSGLGTVSVTFS
ncbi:2-keto-4-pentenoate hydratase [Mycolicibacterium sp. P1-18]|uniref:2-keto-4-pentenoate hydratase n=1 Tax=Mycolicibacterium sp. P1-18 TaxID=2024615 RepID=UPI0011F34217|nr:fumarylacetoacetate hydrolase family protein [Mycolicibacterium sp. P1-18]KAA0092037.1 2-keto-4-pentenoate hydratase [Mycolicibacterium sp. P1-18]